MELQKLRIQNPQWDSLQFFYKDPVFRELSRAKYVLSHPVEKKIKVEPERVYILRGPRQVGKTTLLKLILKKLLEKGVSPLRTFYFALDIGGIREEEQLFDLLVTYIDFASTSVEKPFFIFLDEATYTRDWALGFKRAFDLGVVRDCFVIITGSSSLELKKGGERLPGRRGLAAHETDLQMLPITFREFLKNVAPEVPLPEVKLSSPALFKAAMEISYYSKELKNLFKKYLLSGGFPLSINDLLKNGAISPASYYTYLQALLGDLTKAGKREGYLKELIYTIVEKRMEPLDAHLISQLTSIGSHNTVSSYIEVLEALFVLTTIYHAKNLTDPRPSFRRRRKFYFSDPFLFHTLASWAEGYSDSFFYSLQAIEGDFAGKLVENTIGAHLKRKDEVFYWRGKKGELDFIFGRKPLFIEVKFKEKITAEDLKIMKKIKEGLVITKENLSKLENIYMIPAHLFLALID